MKLGTVRFGEIDIDEKLNELVNAHNAIYECIAKVIDYINFPQYSIGFGGNTEWTK